MSDTKSNQPFNIRLLVKLKKLERKTYKYSWKLMAINVCDLCTSEKLCSLKENDIQKCLEQSKERLQMLVEPMESTSNIR